MSKTGLWEPGKPTQLSQICCLNDRGTLGGGWSGSGWRSLCLLSCHRGTPQGIWYKGCFSFGWQMDFQSLLARNEKSVGVNLAWLDCTPWHVWLIWIVAPVPWMTRFFHLVSFNFFHTAWGVQSAATGCPARAWRTNGTSTGWRCGNVGSVWWCHGWITEKGFRGVSKV